MKKICVDGGHGQFNNQGVIKTYYEGTQMFKLANYVKDELEKYEDVLAIVTRNNIADNPSLAVRGQMATGFDLFLSLHSNAPGTGSANYNAITGTTVLDSVTKPNLTLAEDLGAAVAKAMGHSFRGVVQKKNDIGTDWYGVLRSSIASGCKSAILIEHGFHTNNNDCAFLLKDENLKILAKIEVEILAKHYNLVLKGNTIDTHLILGEATATAAQGAAWAKNSGATDLFVSLADKFWNIAEKAGVNPVVAYAQSAKETAYGKFGGVIDESYKNPCGLKTSSGGGNYDPNAHKRFDTWEQGITAHIDHLKLYAGAPGYPKANTPDPRHFPYIKGKAPTVEALGGNWAPSSTYGESIVALMKKIENTPAPIKLPTPKPEQESNFMFYVQAGAYTKIENATEQIDKIKAAGFDAILKKVGNLYKVQTGAFKDKENAYKLAERMEAKGFDTFITSQGGTVVNLGPKPEPIIIGSKVKIKDSATNYSTGQKIPAWVKVKTYTVMNMLNDKVLLREIFSWINLNDVYLA